MAYASDKKPGELTALTTLATDDVFVVGDTSDASEVAKVITKANLINDLGTSFAAALGADDNYVTDAEKTIIAATTASYTTAEASKLAGIEALADVTDAGNVGSSIHGATAKTTPVDADTMPLIDSAASNVLKKVTWANIKATIKAYTDTLYAAALGADDNYVTDAEKTKLANLSGTNTGDQDLSGYVTKATYDAHTVLAATTDNTPVALTVGEQTVVGRVTGGNIAALAIDSDLSSVSANDDTLPSAKATKAALDLKAPLASPTFTGTVTLPVGLTGVIRTDSGVVSVDTDVTDIVAAASDTAAGKVELAIGSEVTTGTDATRAITPDALAGSEPGKRSVYILVSDPGGSAITTGDGKACVAIDTTINGMNLVAAKSYCTTVSSSGNPTVQLRRSRRTNATTRSDADMLSTALSIDANEFESADATTAVGINTSNDDVQTGDMIFVDIDTAGTGCKGLGVLLTFQTP